MRNKTINPILDAIKLHVSTAIQNTEGVLIIIVFNVKQAQDYDYTLRHYNEFGLMASDDGGFAPPVLIHADDISCLQLPSLLGKTVRVLTELKTLKYHGIFYAKDEMEFVSDSATSTLMHLCQNAHCERYFVNGLQPNSPHSIERLTSKAHKESVVEGILYGNSLDKVILSDPLKGTKFYDLALHIADSAQFPFETTLLIGFGCFSVIAQVVYHVQYEDGTPLPLGEYVVCEQPPAASKSRVLRAFNQHAQRYLRAIPVGDENSADSELERSLNLYTTDTTPEALESILNKQGGVFALVSAEQGVVNTLLGESGGRDQSKDLILKGFNGEWHASFRITREGYSGLINGAVVCIAQEGTINTILHSSKGMGVAERFLFMSEPNLLGKRTHQRARSNMLNHDAVVYYESKIVQLLDTWRVRQVPEFEGLQPLKLTSQSWDRVYQLKDELEPTLADGEENSLDVLRGALGKMDIHVMKIATLLHIYEQEQNIGIFVDDKFVVMAIELMRRHILSLRNVLYAKGVMGSKAEWSAILAMFDNKQVGFKLLERQIIMSRSKVSPFKNVTGNRSEVIRKSLHDMVHFGLLNQSKMEFSLM